MSVRYIITPKNLREAVKGLPRGTTLDFLSMFLSIITNNIRDDPNYFDQNTELGQVLFEETFPSLVDHLISHEMLDSLISTISLFLHICEYLSLVHKFIFIPFMKKLFDTLQTLYSSEIYIDFQYKLKNIKEKVDLNIFQKYLIDQLSKYQIIKVMINDFLIYQSFSECADFFTIFNQVFPFVKKSVLQGFENEFSRFSFSLDDPRFDDIESLQLTKAMATCSPKYAQLHFDNIIKFLLSDDNEVAKVEFVKLIGNQENLQCISQNVVDMFDIIMATMREDERFLGQISSILYSNNLFNKEFFIEKAGDDLYFNSVFFDFVKQSYTKEIVKSIIESEQFCEKTVDFGFRVIDYNVELIPNLSLFLQQSFSTFWKEERMETIASLIKKKVCRQELLDSINNYQIKNQNDCKIVCEFLILLKPKIDEFNYDTFINDILFHIDSIFIIHFFTINSFIPVNLIDIEDLVSFSIFNEKLSSFLFDNFSDVLSNHIDFFLTLQVEKESESKIFGRFLFDLFKRTNSSNNNLVWESIVRLHDEDEEVHNFAQKLINEQPNSSQKEILAQIENGYSKYFINFDFASFPENSAEENGNYLFFRKPLIVSSDSFFYFPSKIGHALNNSEQIEESDVKELFEFQLGDIGIDAIILSLAFDASMKLNIDFPKIKESLQLAFQLKFTAFVEKLFQYIIGRQEQVIQIDEELLNSFSKFDEKYVIELIQKQKVATDVFIRFFSNYKTFEASSILRKLDFEISKSLLNQIIYTKSDFVSFFQSNRISQENILPYLFSPEFPQFYRTKKVVNSAFQCLVSNQQLLLQFLKSQKEKINSKIIHKKVGFAPHIGSMKYFNVYLVFTHLVPEFCSFSNSKVGDFLSNIIYSKQGEEDSDLIVPIKEPVDEAGKQKVDKVETSRYLLNESFESLLNELPNEVLKKFEFIYSTKRLVSSFDVGMFHDFSMIINENSISKELENFCFLSHPQIFVFKIYSKKEFKIEESIMINDKKYSLTFILTKTDLYFLNRKSGKIQYTKYSNGEKVNCEAIKGKIVFTFYQLEDENEQEFEKLKERFEKFRNCRYNFNERAVICDSLNKANIDWSQWKSDEVLFEIAYVLLCDYGYSGLFKELSSNVQFSEYFFKSDWKEQYSHQNIDEAISNLAMIYPQREELLDILAKSIKMENRKHFSSIILNSLDLSDDYIEKIIKMISPHFDHFEDFIFNFFMRKTTTNSLILQDDKLAIFVFNLIEKRVNVDNCTSLESLPFAHLLTPMTEQLFQLCMKTLRRKSSNLILRSFGKSPLIIVHSLVSLPHTDELANMFNQIYPAKDDLETIEDLRKDVKWVEYALSSENITIRNHSYDLIKLIFTRKDSVFLSSVLKEAFLKSLFLPFFEELVKFIFGYFGIESIDSPELTESIYVKMFNSTTIPVTYDVINHLFDDLSPPPSSSIIKLHSIVLNYSKDPSLEVVFWIHCSSLLFASIQAVFNPPFVGFFEEILTSMAYNCSYKNLQTFFYFIETFARSKGILNYIKLIVEFDVIIYGYIPWISNLMNDFRDFGETELAVLVLNLPSVVLKRQRLIQKAFRNVTDIHQLMIQAFDAANSCFSMILKNNQQQKNASKQVFVRNTGREDLTQLINNIYFSSFLPFFSNDILSVVDSFILGGSSQIASLKKLIKYLTYSSLTFREVLKIVFELIDKVPGFRMFNKNFLNHVEREWSELCCEIAREILSDIELNDPELITRAVLIVDREICTQLYHYNQAEKEYLRFLIGVMKNDKLRQETKLQSNPQIFNVFRNDFVFCIDDVSMFIDISLDKYEKFFNEEEVLNFILKLHIDDNQIKQKLKIVSLLFKKRQNQMKCLIEKIFPKIEELSSAEGIEAELSDQINCVFEEALEVFSLL